MTLKEREKYALKWVNKIRKENGMHSTSRLSRGVRRHPRACTLAMSLKGTRPIATVTIQDSEIRKFMEDFDIGKYPHLEIPLQPKYYKRGRKKVLL